MNPAMSLSEKRKNGEKIIGKKSSAEERCPKKPTLKDKKALKDYSGPKAQIR